MDSTVSTKNEKTKVFTILKNEHHKQKKWTEEYDKILSGLVENDCNKKVNWEKISKHFKDKTGRQCYLRYRHIMKSYNKGQWTKYEIDKLNEAIAIHGKNWSKISEIIQTRSGKQIRDHYIYSICNRKKFSPEEDNKILELYKKFGNRFSLIAKEFPNRITEEIKSRFYASIKKNLNLKVVVVDKINEEVEKKDQKDNKEFKEFKDYKDYKDFKDYKETKEIKELMNFRGNRGNQSNNIIKVVIKIVKDNKDNRVAKTNNINIDNKDNKDNNINKDNRVNKDNRDNRDNKDNNFNIKKPIAKKLNSFDLGLFSDNSNNNIININHINNKSNKNEEVKTEPIVCVKNFNIDDNEDFSDINKGNDISLLIINLI